MANRRAAFLAALALLLIGWASASDESAATSDTITLDGQMGKHAEGSRTDDEVVQKDEERIKLDGLNVAQIKELRDRMEKGAFQAEVNRMMKLIINSLYKNKEIFLRELISNASDALDKIRLLSLTDKNALSATDELSIKIKADKDNKILHITDTGIGMTKQELINNLGTIAKSGTSEFFEKMSQSEGNSESTDLIGQFGVGFYSSFLIADRVVVTSKHNDDKQYIWESDSSAFSIVEDPRGDSLKRGTTISLYLKDEASDFCEHDTLKNLIKKYSQFINFPIYLWTSKTETVEEPIEEDEEKPEEDKPAEDEEKKEDTDDEAKVEEDKTDDEKEKKPKTKSVEKTTWDWELINDSKPIWLRKPAEVEDKEYDEFYKSITKDRDDPLAKSHFIAEGEVTFKALLFVPKVQPNDAFGRYGTDTDNVKLYVRRVFITDEFSELIPKYLAFVRGVIDSDDLPLNVSRETLQQHKLLKVIKKKIVRKILDTLKKLDAEKYKDFYKEYSTNIKLGVVEDTPNRQRLAKLLMFHSSNNLANQTLLADYVTRMKPKQEHIYYAAAATKEEAEKSPFVERLIKKGYEVLLLGEAIDEYTISSLPEFDGKKFQNVAKEGLKIEEGEKAKERKESLVKQFEPLTKWLHENALKDKILKAEISDRLADSPVALVAGQFGWTANMERLSLSNAHSKSHDSQRDYYLNQKKTLEINPRHPIIKNLLQRVIDDKEDAEAKETAQIMFETAALRSGYSLRESGEFANRIERLIRNTLGVDPAEKVEEEIEDPEDETAEDGEKAEEEDAEAKEEGDDIAHEEL